MNPKTYLFFGNIGAGKGTQVEFLKKDLKDRTSKETVYISPGAEFRNFIEGEGYSNKLAKEILDRGQLLPLFLVSWVFANVVTKELDSPDKHIIMDGFPRSVEQVSLFESAVKFYNLNDISIVYIKISKEEATRRLMLRARHDDTEAGIQKRFEEYENNVLPALDLLRQKNIPIFEINGEQSIEDVHKEIISKVFGA